jgi:hypothetical protein
LLLVELLECFFKVEINCEDIDTVSLFEDRGVSAKDGVTIKVETRVIEIAMKL